MPRDFVNVYSRIPPETAAKLEARAAALNVRVNDLIRSILDAHAESLYIAQPVSIMGNQRQHADLTRFQVWLKEKGYAHTTASTAATVLRRALRELERDLAELAIEELQEWAGQLTGRDGSNRKFAVRLLEAYRNRS